MDKISIILFELLQLSVGNRQRLSIILSHEEWEKVFCVMKKQALTGIVFDAICHLPPEQRPPRNFILQGAAQTDLIVRQNHLLNQRVMDLNEIMSNIGLPYCILKGQGVGLLYPNPEYRNPGDIDVWCDSKDRNLMLEKVGEKYKTKETLVHHTHVDFFEDTKVDLHYIPTWLFAPWYYKKLVHFFTTEKNIQMNNKCELGFNVPTIKFNLVYSMLHIFWHFMSSGIGLRQLMDYYYIILHSTEWERKEATDVIRKIGKTRFLSAVMYVLQNVFLLEEKYLLVKPNPQLGKILLNEILIGGNFGFYNESHQKSPQKSRLKNLKILFSRFLNFFTFAPSEVICSPFWKIWHYCWRKKNGYL